MGDIQAKLDYADAISDWFLEIAEEYSDKGDFEESLKCNYIAATILSRQNRNLSSEKLESNIRFIAEKINQIPDYPNEITKKTNNLKTKSQEKEVCLHVMSEALPAGGITQMVIRWMKNDSIDRIHSLVLLEDQLPIPPELLEVVAVTGGSVYKVSPATSMVQQSVWLKSLANELATYIILHIDVSDVICGAAFGGNGGPPVLLVNYTAQAFWSGATIADLVLNVRGSTLEKYWTETYRGISRYATLPIPLSEPSQPTSSLQELKNQARMSLDLPQKAFVIITVGASFKYSATKTMDFVKVWVEILNQIPDSYLLAVGFDGDSRWKNAANELNGRVKTLGAVSQAKLAIIHEAADLYAEGFPFGTTTALLETCIKGIPAVLSPAECPPPYGTDGVAIDDVLERSKSLTEYQAKVIQLYRSPAERLALGDKLQKEITCHHTGLGWIAYLENAFSKLPQVHCPQTSISPVRTPEQIHEHWSELVAKFYSGYEETLEHAVSRALTIGIRPKLTNSIMLACKKYQSLRYHRTIPLNILIFYCNFLQRVIPLRLGAKIFRFFSFFFRASLWARIRSKLKLMLGRTEPTETMYGEYRKMFHSTKNCRK